MTEKLETKLEQVEIKQTRDKVEPIRFKDDAINKIKKDNYNFGKKRFKYIPFKVSKDSHQKGVLLKILKGTVEDKQTDKVFCLRFWFNGKADIHWIGKYSQTFGTKECDEYHGSLYVIVAMLPIKDAEYVIKAKIKKDKNLFFNIIIYII